MNTSSNIPSDISPISLDQGEAREENPSSDEKKRDKATANWDKQDKGWDKGLWGLAQEQIKKLPKPIISLTRWSIIFYFLFWGLDKSINHIRSIFCQLSWTVHCEGEDDPAEINNEPIDLNDVSDTDLNSEPTDLNDVSN